LGFSYLPGTVRIVVAAKISHLPSSITKKQSLLALAQLPDRCERAPLTNQRAEQFGPPMVRVRPSGREVARFGRASNLEMLDPAGLAHMLLVKAAQARGHDAGSAQITNHPPGIAALHDRQATNIVAQHLGGSLV